MRGTRGFDPGVLGFKRVGGALRHTTCEHAVQGLGEAVWDCRLVGHWATHTEVYGAIARLHRSNELNDVERLVAVDRLELLGQEWDQVEPNDAVRYEATRVHDRYSLRSADALQLAAALVWCRNRPAGRTFLCADGRLIPGRCSGRLYRSRTLNPTARGG